MAELYRILASRTLFFLRARIPNQEVNDRIHETFKLVVLAIQRGQLREPDRLMGFVHTVLKRQIAAAIDQAVVGRKAAALDGCFEVRSTASDPEQTASSRERLKIVVDTLAQLPEKQRIVLTEFYLNEKPAHQICTEMHLTETQFRLLKSRAKKLFGNVGRRMVMRGRTPTGLGRDGNVGHSNWSSRPTVG